MEKKDLNNKESELHKDIELEGYEYIKEENIINIPIGSRIYYFSKNDFLKNRIFKKTGILVNIQNPEILKLRGGFNSKWYIYTNQYYIFYKKKIHKKNAFKEILTKLVEEDFKSIQPQNYVSSSTSTSDPSFSES